MTRREVIPFLALLATTAIARANEETIDMSHAVFIAMAGSQHVPYIDPDTDRIAGSIDIGVVPDQVELAASISKLLITDGRTQHLRIVDLISGEVATVSLDFIPRRIAVSPDGLTVALADPETGLLVLIDLLRRQGLGSAAGPGQLKDMLFSADGHTLFLSAGTTGTIFAVDVASPHAVRPLETGVPSATLALTRSPNGRRLFVQSSDGTVGVVDLEHQRPFAPIESGAGSTAAFPSASGSRLLIVNNQSGTLTIVRDGSTPSKTILQAATGVNVVYTAWFESLALVPSATARALLLYDLDTMKPLGSVRLVAAPGRGGITPDGQKLYLPLPDARQIVVFDARQRQLVASISVPDTPAKVFLAGSYGVCH